MMWGSCGIWSDGGLPVSVCKLVFKMAALTQDVPGTREVENVEETEDIIENNEAAAANKKKKKKKKKKGNFKSMILLLEVLKG